MFKTKKKQQQKHLFNLNNVRPGVERQILHKLKRLIPVLRALPNTNFFRIDDGL